MKKTSYAYFVEGPRTTEDLMALHPYEQGRAYNHQRIQTKTKLTPLELRCQSVA